MRFHVTEQFCHLVGQRQHTVGVLGFERVLFHLSVDPQDLSLHRDRLLPEIDVRPFQAQQFPSPKSCHQFGVVEFVLPAVSGFLKEPADLFGFSLFSFCATQGEFGACVRFDPLFRQGTAPGSNKRSAW